MITLTRTDTSVVGRWWWTVDRWTLLAMALLIAIGAVLTMAASPAVAERIGLESFHFARRQLIFLVPAVMLMISISMLTPRAIRRLAIIGFIISMVLLAGTMIFGTEIKGATRWLSLGLFSIQPSEFVKPFFIVVTAWMLALQKEQDGIPGNLIAGTLAALVIGLLLVQPDFGMAVIVALVWCAQVFMAGLPLLWVGGLIFVGGAAVFAVYVTVPHVASRIDRFLDPSLGDTFQIETAIDAFANGSLLGRGPGEGIGKRVLPDAHTDFIFAVAGEEFGLIVCLIVVALFAYITLRGYQRLAGEDTLFIMLAAGGLLTQFGLQAIINMGVNLHLLPTKGMTLPFISYGGSSLLALSFGMGMVIALTRRRPRHEVAA
jgi:cell division protein FtsW